jgi:uncharacterized protein (DUF697 family)
MSRTLKAASVWRVIKDVDLDAMRRASQERFTIVVAADDGDDAAQVRALLSAGATSEPHPWITADTASATQWETPPLAAVLVSRDALLSAPLATLRTEAARDGVPVVTVIVRVGGASGTLTPEPSEVVRLAVPAIGSGAATAIATAVLQTLAPDRRLAVARQLPIARPAVLQALIDETARANASFALTTGLAETVPILTVPLNVGDLVVLTKNQLVMAYKMALASGRDGEPGKLVAEIAGVLGGGFLFRQVARQLVGLIPIIGLVPKVAVAYGGTWAVGRAMGAWLTDGRALTADAVRAFSNEGRERGRELARKLVEAAGRRRGN